MEYLIGVGVALAVALLVTIVGLDKERGLYPVVLMVIASYYILFAATGGSSAALAAEAPPMAVFVLLALVGYKRNAWLLVIGLAGHSVFDYTHASWISNPGVPQWWPGFCLAYDFTAAAHLAVLLMLGRSRVAA
jgi:hypothetical protein